MTPQTQQEIAAGLDCPELLAARVVDDGQNNIVLDSGRLIVRLARHRRAEDELRQEAATLAVLAGRLPLAIPAPCIRPIGDRVVSVHSRLPGKALASIADLADAARAARNLAGFLHALHALPIELLPQAADNGQSVWRPLFETAATRLFPLLPTGAAETLAAGFASFLPTVPTLPQTIIHGDFGTGNILVSDGEIAGIIDFAGCSVGDPAYDLAGLVAGLGDEFLPLLDAHYPITTGTHDRIRFYRGLFAVEEALFGLEQGDERALQAGLDALASRTSS